MKDMATVAPGSAQGVVPDNAGFTDGLRDLGQPVQVEELPQGVLDLLAALTVRPRPAGELGGLDIRLREQARSYRGLHSNVGDLQGGDGRHREQARSHRGLHSSVVDLQGGDGRLREQARSYRGLHSAVGDLQGLDGRHRWQASSHRDLHSIGGDLQGVDGRHREQGEAVSITGQTHSQSETHSPVGAGLPAMASAQAPDDLPAENVDTPTLTASMNPHGPRLAVATPPLPVPLPSAPIPRPVPDAQVATPPGPAPGLLQVPFNKGAVSGQVTISREADESARPLLLSASNPLVFEQLKAPFEQLREPAWRLADQHDEQQRQGSRPPPDEEPQESCT